MTLYEYDKALLDLMESVDPETGEWSGDPEEWDRLNMERDQKLESTACYIKDLRGDIKKFEDELKETTQRLQARLNTLRRKEAWLVSNLTKSLAGENFETARCSLRFKRNAQKVQIDDREELMRWAEINAPDIIKYKQPDLSKNDIKTIIKDGRDVPGCRLVQDIRLEVK